MPMSTTSSITISVTIFSTVEHPFKRHAYCSTVVALKSIYNVYLCYVHFRYRGTVIGNRYGPGTGPILLDDVNCVGNETSIAYCRHGGWGVHNCDHSKDVSVSCGSSPVQYGN